MGLLVAIPLMTPPCAAGSVVCRVLPLLPCKHRQTGPLFECMGKHRHYYGAQLDGMDSRKQEVQQQVQQQAAPQGADAAGAGSNSPGGSSSGSGSGGGNSSDGDGTAGSHSLQASNSSADTAKGGTGGAARGSEQLGDAAAAGRGMAAL